MSNLTTVTLHESERDLFALFTVTLHKFIPVLNFNSTKKELFVIVVQEKYAATAADWAEPSGPGTSLIATNATS